MKKTLHLVVGGMKCGTTTAFNSITNPDVGRTPKESSPLDPATMSTEQAIAALKPLLDLNPEVYDVSTRYTMIPLVTGVAKRATDIGQILGTEIRPIYLIRDRWDRLRSHVLHDQRRGLKLTADKAIANDPRYVSFGLYGSQLQPWVNSGIGTPVLVQTSDIAQFFAARGALTKNSRNVSNAAEDDIVARRSAAKFLSSDFYTGVVRPRVPEAVRLRLAARLRERDKPDFDPNSLPRDLRSMISSQFEADQQLVEQLANSGSVNLYRTHH